MIRLDSLLADDVNYPELPDEDLCDRYEKLQLLYGERDARTRAGVLSRVTVRVMLAVSQPCREELRQELVAAEQAMRDRDLF